MSHVVKTLGVTLVLINDATSNLGANWVNIGIGINDIQFVMFKHIDEFQLVSFTIWSYAML
jgi:hypothetical protein